MKNINTRNWLLASVTRKVGSRCEIKAPLETIIDLVRAVKRELSLWDEEADKDLDPPS